jgi:hypothetical protein
VITLARKDTFGQKSAAFREKRRKIWAGTSSWGLEESVERTACLPLDTSDRDHNKKK